MENFHHNHNNIVTSGKKFRSKQIRSFVIIYVSFMSRNFLLWMMNVYVVGVRDEKFDIFVMNDDDDYIVDFQIKFSDESINNNNGKNQGVSSIRFSDFQFHLFYSSL